MDLRGPGSEYTEIMKWLTVLIVTLAASLTFAQGWKTVSSKEVGLTFSVPSTPKTSSRTDKEGNYTIQSRMWVSQASGANFVASVSIIPTNAPAALGQNMIKGIKKGFLNSTSAKVVNEKAATYAGISGTQITFKNPQNVQGALWIVNRGSKIFTFTVAKQNANYSAEVKKFFGSVKLAR